MTNDECLSILSTLAKKTGVKDIRVQPLAALTDQSSDYELLMSFDSLAAAKGDCSSCPTEDFVVKEAKEPNIHGCDLQLDYGKECCAHTTKQMQFQFAQQIAREHPGAKRRQALMAAKSVFSKAKLRPSAIVFVKNNC